MFDHAAYPRLAKAQKTRFYLDFNMSMEVNGKPMPLAYWNMLCSYRDLQLWVRMNMKPHRGWKVSVVKRYFGLKGSGDKMLSDFECLMHETKCALGLIESMDAQP
jgi:hypothetical protein